MERGEESAVLFAELIGTAELYARAGDAAAHEEIARGIERLGKAAASSGARVLKTIGGGRIMVLAPSADAAAAAAVAMQVAAGRPAAPGASGLTLGVGFHYGPVLRNADDVFGDTVNVAARLVEKAGSGQILLAAATAAALGPLYRSSMRRLYSMPLKGRSEQIELCELVWREDQVPTHYPLDTAAEASRAELRLEHRGAKLALAHERDALTIGRDAGCDLVVGDEEASRVHCTIKRRHDHFVLADQSTNGTFVTVEGEGEVLVQREELALRKHGWITLGRPRSAAKEVVEFFCD